MKIIFNKSDQWVDAKNLFDSGNVSYVWNVVVLKFNEKNGNVFHIVGVKIFLGNMLKELKNSFAWVRKKILGTVKKS